jgi:hypothetical protein
MRIKARFGLLAMGTGLAAFLTAGLIWAQDYSHARIVRLSYVEGTVTLQRPDVTDWATAPVNTPLQEGFKLMTAENSFAEVEFENASTVRLGQLTLLEFTQLALMPSGGKVNRLTLQQGYATFHAIPEGGDIYEIKTASSTLVPRGKALFRVDLDEGAERVEVFKGSVDVSGVQGSWTLAKNAVLELRQGGDQPYSLAEGVTKDAWDEWVEERENRATLARNGPSPGAYTNDTRELIYGWNDLSPYGVWSYLPGYGYGWIPTVSYGWAPYSMGRWCWYPGFGYTWISAEPWGWLPYHYGGWNYMPGIGWSWFPGNFGFWSPGLVDWYMGAGWIGWAPRSGVASGGPANNCQQTQHCGTAVGINNFQNGRSVMPGNTLPVNPLHGRRVDQPDLPPGLLGRLPGSPVLRPEALARPENGRQGGPGGAIAGNAGVAGGPSRGPAVGFSSRRGTVAPESGVVFDPVEGRYVNSQTATAASEVNREVVGSRSNAETPPRPVERGGIAPLAGGEGSKALGRTGAATPSGVVGAPSPRETPRAAPSGARLPSTSTSRPSASAASEHSRGGWFHHSAPSSGSGGRSSGFEGGGRASGSGDAHMSGSSAGGGGISGGGGAHVSGSSGGGGGMGGGGGAHGGASSSSSGPHH